MADMSRRGRAQIIGVRGRFRRFVVAGVLGVFAGLAAAGCGAGGNHGEAASLGLTIRGARAAVKEVPRASAYRGPASGPPAQLRAPIVFVAAELTDGATAAVARGVQQAARAIGWPLRIVDGGATASSESATLRAALRSRPGGIVLGGVDAADEQPVLHQAGTQGIPVVGWHAAAQPGPDRALALYSNVGSDPAAVARLAADYAIADSGGKAGVVVFTDSEYAVDRQISRLISAQIESCAACAVLQLFDQPVATAALGSAGEVSAFLQRYGPRFGYVIAVNGAYVEGASAALRGAGLAGSEPPFSIVAGGGEEAEFTRIRTGEYQKASVAEPLNLQGWQLVDELNRARAGQPPSGYVAPPALVTQSNVPNGPVYEPAGRLPPGLPAHLASLRLRAPRRKRAGRLE